MFIPLFLCFTFLPHPIPWRISWMAVDGSGVSKVNNGEEGLSSFTGWLIVPFVFSWCCCSWSLAFHSGVIRCLCCLPFVAISFVAFSVPSSSANDGAATDEQMGPDIDSFFRVILLLHPCPPRIYRKSRYHCRQNYLRQRAAAAAWTDRARDKGGWMA